MLLNQESSQLVLIDYQEKLMPAIYEADAVFRNAMILGTLAKKMRVPVYGTEHVPDKIGKFIPELAAMCKATMRKTQFSACPEGLTELLLPKPKSGNARSLPKH